MSVDTARKLRQANRWRDQYNPLRSLTIARAVSMFEAAQRGEYADLQWTYRFIERRDADLIALIERRVNVIVQMDWAIKTVDEKSAAARGIPFDPDLAENQARELRAAYEKIGNLYQAIEHLAMAVFREFAVAQFQRGDKAARPGDADHIECLNSWNIVRDGMVGDWFWNPDAKQTGSSGLQATDRIDPAFCLIREWPRPLDEIALLKFIRSNLSQKDWDGFVEIYGLPGWLVIMPQSVPAGKEADYKAAAEAVAEGNSGALPAGSDAKCADQPRGSNPFRDHLQYLTEKLVLAGTGGMLTMLSAPGSGTLAGGAHAEAFDIVARGEARKISEVFQRQFDRVILDARFAGKPRLAYFALAANEEQDVGEILDHAVKIVAAGGQVDFAELSEKTGYKITPAPAPASPFPVAAVSDRRAPFSNRAPADPSDPSAPSDSPDSARSALVSASVRSELAARQDILAPWLARVEALAADSSLSEPQFLNAFEKLVNELPAAALTPEAIATLAGIREGALGAAVVNALASENQEPRTKNQEP